MRLKRWSNFVLDRMGPVGIVCYWALMAVIGVGQVCGEQSFFTKPNETSVIAGQMAILNCVILDKVGPLQWTKDGFSMGSDRDLPGFSRYQMIGSEAQGEYNLMISNTNLDDDAEFECQVGPRPNHPALKHSAHLHVLIPPNTPEIEDHANGTVVEVPYEQKTLNLTCTSKNSKPAADLKWLRNGEAISEDIQYLTEDAGNKLQNAQSTLTISPKNVDNEAFFICQASNAASQGSVLETTVQLSVMHPPQKPNILGYVSGRIVKTGDTIKLLCVAAGGNPLAQVYWYKNDMELDFSYETGHGKAQNELIFTVEPTDNEAVYRCDASNRVTPQPLSAHVKFTVQFGPLNVKLTGNQHAKAGDTITLTCTSGISNPPATITWYGGTAITPKFTPVISPSPKGGFITTSNITVELTDKQDDMLYQCQGFNEALGKTETDAITLTVMYPPEHRGISGYQSRKMEAGDSLSLTCTTHGGNPLPTLTWWKGDEELQGEQRQNGQIKTSQLNFLLKPEDNQAEYQCNATNPATPDPLIKSVRLSVNFPPKGLNLSTVPRKPKAGERLTITCRSGSSNPESVLTWSKEGNKIQGRYKETVDAEWGGRSSVSELEVVPTPENHGEMYSCTATNSFLNRAVSDAITLDISYKPVFSLDAVSTVSITEGNSELLNLTASGNPQPITYTWYKDSVWISSSGKSKRDVSMPHFIMDGGVINMTNVSRNDAGSYTCEASNTEGATNISVTLVINYPASISYITERSVKDQNARAALECHADANPMPDDLITWSRVGYNMSHTHQEDSPGKSTLIIYNVTKGDSGKFICKAFNSIKEAVTKVAELVVKYAPEIDPGLALRKAAAPKGETASLICKAEGAPDVTFTWLKVKQILDVSQPKYKESTEKLNIVQYQSTLMVFNVTTEDYGAYECQAKNELGLDRREIILDDTSRPDPPYDIRVVNATHDSIKLTWMPGFNGGAPQRFNVQYKPAGSEGHKTDQVLPRNATVYVIKGLERATKYELTVQAENDFGASPFQEKVVIGTTAVHASHLLSHVDDVPLIIILTVSIIGMILLGLNVLLILFFIRRRRRKLEKDASESTSNANTVEMFSAPTVTEDSKSYTTFDHRSLDDYPDDPRIYDPDDELKRFLPPPAYGAIDPYGPHPPSHYYGPAPHLVPASYGPHGMSPSPHMDTRPFNPGGSAWDNPKYDSYSSMPRMVTPGSPADDNDDYANQLRKVQKNLTSGGTLDPAGRVPNRRDAKGPASLPPTRAPPPPPPTRSSSKGAADAPKSMPPLPTRNYAPEDVPRGAAPRYVPPPAFPASSGVRPRSNYYTGPLPSQPSYPAPPPPKPPQSDVRGSSHNGSARAPSSFSLNPCPTPPADVQGHLV